VGHWLPVPLPGGDAASRDGWRAAVGYAVAAGEALPSFSDVAPAMVQQAARQAAAGVNAPQASSMGRLFDAAAALAGVRSTSRYEGHAAMELEAAAAVRWDARLETDDAGVELRDVSGAPLVVSPLPLLRERLRWGHAAPSATEAALAVHRAVVAGTVAAVQTLAARHGVTTVALGGGTWQNALLLGATYRRLSAEGFRVLTPRALPPNDGGIAYGQAVVAIARESSGNSR
jgi:hydrogenase maturation protein HypF